MGAAFIDARNEGLLVKGGGHAMAGGFTVLKEHMDDFQLFLTRHIEKQMEGSEAVNDMQIDAMLSVHGAKPDFIRMIQNTVGPFGTDHPEPLFVLPQVRLHKVDVVGAGHIRAMVSDWEGGTWMKAMAFRAVDTPLGDLLLDKGQQTPLHLAGYLKVDSWNGRESVEMHVQDAARV